MKCPKCESEPIKGSVLYRYDEGRSFPLVWSKLIGREKKKGIFGMKDVDKYENKDIYARKFSKCNYLELYAGE